jgi:hypothetical protein
MTDREFKKNKHGSIYGNLDFITPIGRAQYCNLAKPSEKYGKYGLRILWLKEDIAKQPKSKAKLNAMIAEGQALIDAAKLSPKALAAITNQPIFDGDDVIENDKGEEVAPHPGYYYITVNDSNPLDIVGPDNSPIEAALIKPGMLVRAIVQGMFFSIAKGASGITWKPQTLQFVKDDGVRLYSGPNSKGLLGTIEDIEDEMPSGAVEAQEADESHESEAIEPAQPTKASSKVKGKSALSLI